MEITKKVLYSYAFAVLCLIGAVVIYFTLIQQALIDISASKSELESEQNILAQTQKTWENVQRLQKEYEAYGDQVARLEIALPKEKDVPGILVQLQEMGTKNNVTIKGIDFQKKGSTASSETTEQVAGASNSGVTPQAPTLKTDIISFQAVAPTYDAVKNFIKDIELNLRIMDVGKVDIKESTQAATSATPEATTFEASFEMKTYQLK